MFSAEVAVESETSVSFYSIICSSDGHIVMTEINLQSPVKGQVQNSQGLKSKDFIFDPLASDSKVEEKGGGINAFVR